MNIKHNEVVRPTILIVDDTPENITVLGEMLHAQYAIRVATSGPRALISATSTPLPDLILLDVMMPEMDGYAVLGHLRENPVTAEIPVIFVTALDATEDETHGLEMGAADYITKPLRPSIVLARVHCQLELKKARDRIRDQNNWLEKEIARRMEENQKIQDASMRALASLAETRDNETGNHIRRTQGYVEALCRALNESGYPNLLSERQIQMITKAAPLHDIGKVGIPDNILLKPGKLDEAEWKIMRTHSQIGADAISRAIADEPDQSMFEFLRIAMDIAHYHHEKWDGSGYPEGLQAEAIPLPARLMALADVYDALINRRCYKDGMSFEKATQIIVDGKGSHFDPLLVEAFINCQSEFMTIAHRYADQHFISPDSSLVGQEE